MESTLVIARYNEDINWVNNLDTFSKKIIYNKGENLQNLKNTQIIDLPNIGRESHTWLHHIVQNYEKLSHYNVFVQGRIDDLGCMSFKNPNDYLVYLKKNSFVVSRLGLLGPFHWKNNLGIENDIRYKEAWTKGGISNNKEGFRKYAKKFFNKIPLITATSYGGCFGVTKNAITKMDKNFYINLLRTVSNHPHPIEAHYLERLWCYMFSKNDYLIQAFLDVIKTKLERKIHINFQN